MSGARKQNKQFGASEWMRSASKRVSGEANGPMLVDFIDLVVSYLDNECASFNKKATS